MQGGRIRAIWNLYYPNVCFFNYQFYSWQENYQIQFILFNKIKYTHRNSHNEDVLNTVFPDIIWYNEILQVVSALSIQCIWTSDLFSLSPDDWPCYYCLFPRSELLSLLKLHFCREAKSMGIAYVDSLVMTEQCLCVFLPSPPALYPFHRCTSGIPSQACFWICARGDLEESW